MINFENTTLLSINQTEFHDFSFTHNHDGFKIKQDVIKVTFRLNLRDFTKHMASDLENYSHLKQRIQIYLKNG